MVVGVLSLEIDRKEEDVFYHDDLWPKRTPIHTKNYIEWKDPFTNNYFQNPNQTTLDAKYYGLKYLVLSYLRNVYPVGIETIGIYFIIYIASTTKRLRIYNNKKCLPRNHIIISIFFANEIV